VARVLGTDVFLLQMYDHIERGWFAISFMAMGFMSVGFVLALFMLGERPLGLRLFKGKIQTPEEQTSAITPSDSVAPIPEPGK